jgi:hypothetical protein
MKTPITEYNAGVLSGLEAAENPTDPMVQDSYWKAVRVCEENDESYPLVLSYWKGWLAGYLVD